MNGGWPHWRTYLYSVITDNGDQRVGLKISGSGVGAPDTAIDPVANRGYITFEGNKSNTFTGDVEVENANLFRLKRSGGATSIQGNIIARNGGTIALGRSHQIANTSIVTLDGRENESGFCFDMDSHEIEESFHQLVVQGTGVLCFFRRQYYSTLLLDDLLIEEGGLLKVLGWSDYMHIDKILVRKDSEHLLDSLERIVFEHDKTAQAGLREYDKDYWEVGPGFPESATYGAIFASGAVGLVFWRKRGQVSALQV